jgi:HJR/Mrr/RecB family endonuclease
MFPPQLIFATFAVSNAIGDAVAEYMRKRRARAEKKQHERKYIATSLALLEKLAAQALERQRQQEAWWRGLSGRSFENELARVLRWQGYQVATTPITGDGGVDLILRKNGMVTVVQCKAHKKRIPIGVARELVASIQDFKAHNAIIATLEGVTGPVRAYIANKPIQVLNLRDILLLQR